eukprot:8018238-Pyramimonas_sp.AAC.1
MPERTDMPWAQLALFRTSIPWFIVKAAMVGPLAADDERPGMPSLLCTKGGPHPPFRRRRPSSMDPLPQLCDIESVVQMRQL